MLDTIADFFVAYWWVIAIIFGIAFLVLFGYIGFVEAKIYLFPALKNMTMPSIPSCPICNCTP